MWRSISRTCGFLYFFYYYFLYLIVFTLVLVILSDRHILCYAAYL